MPASIARGQTTTTVHLYASTADRRTALLAFDLIIRSTPAWIIKFYVRLKVGINMFRNRQGELEGLLGIASIVSCKLISYY